MNVKCPHCDKAIQNVELHHGPIGNALTGPLISGFVVACPTCRSVLGAVPDPDAIASAVAAKLKR